MPNEVRFLPSTELRHRGTIFLIGYISMAPKFLKKTFLCCKSGKKLFKKIDLYISKGQRINLNYMFSKGNIPRKKKKKIVLRVRKIA